MRRTSSVPDIADAVMPRLLARAGHVAASPALRLLVFFALTTVALTAVLAFQWLPNRFQYTVGEVAQTTIKSPLQVTFVSESSTKLARDQAVAVVPDVLRYDPTVAPRQIGAAVETLARVATILGDPTLDPNGRRLAIRAVAGKGIGDATAASIAEWDTARWRAVSLEVVRVLTEAMRGRIAESQLPDIQSRLSELVSPSFTGETATVTADLVASFLRPNMVRDLGASEAARQTARDQVSPVRVSVEKGEVILRDGEVVSELALEKLAAAELLNRRFDWLQLLGAGLFAALVTLALTGYVGFVEPKLIAHERRLLLLSVLVVVTVLAAKLTIPGRELYSYVFPFAAAPMLIATLLGGTMAIIVTGGLGLLVAYVGGGQLDLVVVYVVSGLFGAFIAARAERLNGFFLAGLAASLGAFLAVLAFGLLGGDSGLPRIALHAFLTVVSGGLAAALTIGSSVLLGHAFGITTHMHLLELAHPNQPLLKMLMLNAPGTYHHSIIVANLAERAAEAVGADTLLVRVGAYYHDVGKALRPGYFVENQAELGNIHDHLDPQTSARLIASHVVDGIELARRYRLPPKIRDFIPQHHGTRLVSFFYQKAREQSGCANAQDFRYPGPVPNTRETAILMLADSIEAWVRSSKDKSPQKIDELVDRVVAERLNEGQLDESELTLKEIKAIREAFKGVLRSVYHPRIEYPTATERRNPASPLAAR